jgi:hypothetical protein
VSALPTVKSPDATDAELSYEFFRQLCSLGAVRPAALEHLVSDPRRHRPPRSITYESLRHLFQVIVLVNLELGRIQETPESLLPDAPKYEVAAGGRPLVGFDYIFEVLVSTLDELVATSAATQLVQVYVQPYSAFGRSYPSWKTCASSNLPVWYWQCVLASTASAAIGLHCCQQRRAAKQFGLHLQHRSPARRKICEAHIRYEWLICTMNESCICMQN